MVKQVDVDGDGRLAQTPGHLHVRSTWRRIAAGMIVADNDRARRAENCGPEHFTRMNTASGSCAKALLY